MRAESGAQFLDGVVANLKGEGNTVASVARSGDVKCDEIMPVGGLATE